MHLHREENCCRAMGVDTIRYKVIAFIIGAAFAGIAGAVYASYFTWNRICSILKSVDVLVIVVLEAWSLSGSMLAAILLARHPPTFSPS